MDFEFNPAGTQNSYFKAEEYFPAMVIYSEEELNNRFLGFYYKNTDFFELQVHYDTFALKSFVFTACKHFTIHNTVLHIPEYEEGIITVRGPKRTEYDKFMAHVFTDGLRIDLSDQPAVRHLKCGQLIFAIDASNVLVTLYVVNLTESDIKHVVFELEYK